MVLRWLWYCGRSAAILGVVDKLIWERYWDWMRSRKVEISVIEVVVLLKWAPFSSLRRARWQWDLSWWWSVTCVCVLLVEGVFRSLCSRSLFRRWLRLACFVTVTCCYSVSPGWIDTKGNDNGIVTSLVPALPPLPVGICFTSILDPPEGNRVPVTL